MSVRFVIGRAGSGKSRHCLTSIAAMLDEAPLGPPIFWLLPRSATFQAERELACGLPQQGFFRCRILSVESFVQEILDDCGRTDVTPITPTGRLMILGYLLQREASHLKYFRTDGSQDGLVRRLDATLAEMDRAGADAEMLESLSQPPASADEIHDPILSAKLHDLHHLYVAYNDYVRQERLDPRRHTGELLRRIGGCALLKGATLFVDAFTHFSEMECRILAAAARAAGRMEITLMMNPHSGAITNPHHRGNEHDLFSRTEDIHHRLRLAMNELGVEMEPPLLLEDRPRFSRVPILDAIERTMSGIVHTTAASDSIEAAASVDASQTLHFLEAPDRTAEVDAAARAIQDWLAQGLRMRDIAILARDLTHYHELITAAFAEHGIAHFMDRRRPAGHHPLIQLLSGALEIVRDVWPRDAMLSVLKTGLAAVTLREADDIENYVLAHRIHGTGWAADEPWAYIVESARDDAVRAEPSDLQQERAQQIDRLRRKATDPLKPLVSLLRQETITVGQGISALRRLLEQFDVAGRLEEWIRQANEQEDLEVAAAHQRVWDEAIELLDEMERLLGDETVSPRHFMSLFQLAIEDFDLTLTPPTLDQVLVGQLDRTITPQVKAVIVLGLNEGVFPAVPHEDSILNDADRRILRDRALPIEPPTRRRLLEERFLGYFAFTRASRHLWLMRPRDDTEGKTAAPSPFWLQLRHRFPNAPMDSLPTDVTSEARWIGTPRQLVTGLMRWVRQSGPASPERTAPLPTQLYQWLADGQPGDSPIRRLRDQAWPALSYHNQASLTESTARLLFAPTEEITSPDSADADSTLAATPSQLESFAACPFQHFARHGLRLRQRQQDEQVTALDLHHVYHRVLRRLVRHLLKQDGNWSLLVSTHGRQLIDKICHEVGIALKNEWMLSSSRNQYLLDRIARTIDEVVGRHNAATTRSRFRPACAEMTYGMDGSDTPDRHKNLPPLVLPTPRGNTLRLRGIIDRIDLTDNGSAVITDYRLSGRQLKLVEVMHGLSLQLLICLIALKEGGEAGLGRSVVPVAAFYLRLLSTLTQVEHPDEAGNPDTLEFLLKIKPHGLIDANALADLDQELDEGASPVMRAFIKKGGKPGKPDSTDLVTHEEMEAILNRVRSLAGELADQILAGTIKISPYRLGNVTPCSTCEFRSVCRFDPALDSYHNIEPQKRTEILKSLMEEA